MLTVKRFAEKEGVTVARVLQWIKGGRIPGAKRFGLMWAIPENTQNPRKSVNGRPREPK